MRPAAEAMLTKAEEIAEGKADLDTFIAQLTKEELATIVRGEGMSSPKVTPGTASTFGGVSDRLYEYGSRLPAVQTDLPVSVWRAD